jgi:hypothetical protein
MAVASFLFNRRKKKLLLPGILTHVRQGSCHLHRGAAGRFQWFVHNIEEWYQSMVPGSSHLSGTSSRVALGSMRRLNEHFLNTLETVSVYDLTFDDTIRCQATRTKYAS